MEPATEPQPPDPAYQHQWTIHRTASDTLRRTMPAPFPDEAPELWEERIQAALSEVAAMVPANAREASLAARSVAAGAHVSDCLDQVRRCGNDTTLERQLRAQAASMGREERGFCGLFLRMQAARMKREANDAARDSAALTEHCVLGLLTQGLESLPPLPQVVRPLAPVAPAPAAKAAPPPAEEPPPRPLAWSDLTEAEQQASLLWQEADRYAICHTARVRRIRQLGGLPPDCDYEPPRPEILDMIIHGETSNLLWSDTYESWVPPPSE